MKTFLQLVEEKRKSLAILFGRMNPPTRGHEENVEGLKKMAAEHGADHLVVASHSHDANKNPLDPQTKLKHLRRAFPDTNITASSKEHPTIMHQASEAYKKGYNHLIIAGGGDRTDEYHHLLNKYNGVEGRHGYYKFDHIEVRSTGDRKPGISGTDMRNHVKNGNFNEFRKNLPSHIRADQGHSLELFRDVGRGMGIHENVNRGMGKAIFITGGPGSGKDVIIRECIAEQKIVEVNFVQVVDILNNIHKRGMSSMNPKMEAVRNRGPLIINGPADDYEHIAGIKEQLERIGYETMMIFVDTTDNVSKERNTLLSRMMAESVRHQKWEKAHQNNLAYAEMFETYMRFDNNESLEDKTTDISEAFTFTTNFLNSGMIKESTHTNRFLKLFEERMGAKAIQKANLSSKKMLKDNNSPVMQYRAKIGHIDGVKDGDAKSNSDYIYNRYSEESQPTMIRGSSPKTPNFQKDGNTNKLKRFGDRSLKDSKIGPPSGVGSTYDTRGNTGAAGAGLGDLTYREETSRGGTQDFSNDDVVNFAGQPGIKPNPLREKKTLKRFKEAIDDPGASDMGVSGTLGGASNKEPLVTPMDKYGQSGITIKKKKTGAK